MMRRIGQKGHETAKPVETARVLVETARVLAESASGCVREWLRAMPGD